MKKTTALIFAFLCFLKVLSQNDSIKEIDFNSVDKKILKLPELNISNSLKYDFKIIDSLHYYKNSLKEDILSADYKKDFELHIGNKKSIFKFQCKERIIESCYKYVGYSKNAEVHLISKCRDICELYLIDSYSGSTIYVESEFDGGSYPVFFPGYMILYSSYYDDSYGDYYEYRSIIDVYEMKSINDLEKKFNYIGSINSKNWSIQEIHQSNTENSFMMKIFDERNDFNYIEITIE